MKKTEKIFYKDPFLSQCDAIVTGIDTDKNAIITNQTVAFPEQGGQQGDSGYLIFNEHSIPFNDTQKGGGRMLYLDDFPIISVDTLIHHIIPPEYINLFSINMKLKVTIDIDKRAKLTVNHSGIHLVLMGIQHLYPEMIKHIKGAHITTDQARLDFVKKRTFKEDDLKEITEFINKLVKNDEPITVFPHPEEPEAWYWKSRNTIYPCGGTHLPSASYVGYPIVKRKGMGKKIERIIGLFPNSKLPLKMYHA